jgi:hypothetical protein
MFQELFNGIKKPFNLMSFDPSNYFLKFQKSIRTLTPKVGVHLGVCGLIPSYFFALPRV